jgi:hypothetical protein
MRVPTPVSAVGCSHRDRRPFSVPIALQGRGHTQKGSALPWSEQLGRSTPDLHSVERDPKTRNQKEHEDQAPGVQQPSEIAPERTPGGGQDGDLAQPGRSRGESRCSQLHYSPYLSLPVKERGRVDRALGLGALAVDLAKGPAEAFGPLKAALESISVIYSKYQVCSNALFKLFL